MEPDASTLGPLLRAQTNATAGNATERRSMGRIQRICRLGGLLFFLFALAVSIQLNLIYWCVPFWTRFEVPVEFVFEPKRPQNGEASVVIAQANTLVPSVLVRRLWSRRRGPDSESTSRWTDCFSLDAASFRRGCERSGTIDLELHWTLPDSIRNEQAGTITVELALWQIPHPRSRLQPAPAPLPLCQRRRSVRVLAYRSPTERALRSLLSLPQHFIGALDVWRWSKRPARLSPRNAQRRCIQLLRLRTLTDEPSTNEPNCNPGENSTAWTLHFLDLCTRWHNRTLAGPRLGPVGKTSLA
ncbi:hypothetical protein F1559_003211 [Cyanidiococcus yangmingshanensis]|uniref:Seipin n=1 Tax=Cyanidiococcus yangmingshanensis TaxID=2690220 RepID=A0A7J7II57_9RHOD|nr:hypothetical protein F1559_003211 [Cyanidiococcus yangmingshanensis]